MSKSSASISDASMIFDGDIPIRDISMEQIIEEYDLSIRRIYGRNEFEMYKNYITAVTERKIKRCLNKLCIKSQGKDDTKAALFRGEANKMFSEPSSNVSLVSFYYTKGLRYATIDGEEYARALVSRCQTNFSIKNYQHCLNDVDLCLKAKNCPTDVKAKALYFKTSCYKRLGDTGAMEQTSKQLLATIDELTVDDQISHRRKAMEMMAEDIDETTIQENASVRYALLLQSRRAPLPNIVENPSFQNASNAIRFEYDANKGYRVLANRDINIGECLFVEKAYAYVPFRHLETNVTSKEDESETNLFVPITCYHCTSALFNSVPCVQCVTYLYCTENCRDASWNEYHRWECYGDSADLFTFNNHGLLALRIIFKAVSSGSSLSDIDLDDRSERFGDNRNNYPYIYGLKTCLEKINKRWLTIHCATAALYVQYLKDRTDFFNHVHRLPGNSKMSRNELAYLVGGLIIRHCAQLHRNVIPVRIITDPCVKLATIDQVSKILMTAMTVCPSVSIMNHSCFPNTAHYFIGNVAVVRAIDNIEKGEEIVRPYTSIFFKRTHLEFDYSDLDSRKRLVKKYCFLDCTCDICEDPKKTDRLMNGYKCIRCKGAAGKVSALGRVACFDCKYKYYLSDKSKQKEKRIHDIVSNFPCCYYEGSHVKDLYECLELMNSIYVPYHKLFLTVYDELCLHHIEMGNLTDYLFCSTLQLAHLKHRNINFTDVGVYYYAISAQGYRLLEKKYLGLTRKEMEAVLDLIRKALFESEVILEFYFPSFLRHIDTMRLKLYTLELSYDMREARNRTE